MTNADIAFPEPAPVFRRARRGRVALIQFLLTLGLVATAIALFRTPMADRRHDCQLRMEQLAAATLHYAIERGAYPNDLKTCQELCRLKSRNLVCPNSPLENDPPHADEISGALNAHERTSYIYVGGGVKDTHSRNIVIWLEPKADHAGRGIHVAFADGAVQWITGDEADHILAQVAAGTRPVRIPIESTTQP